MQIVIDIPDELIPQKQEIESIDLHFIDGKLCACTYPFSESSDITNGEILKTIFPSITEEFNNRPDEIIVFGLDANEKIFQLDWWNALYKENK